MNPDLIWQRESFCSQTVPSFIEDPVFKAYKQIFRGRESNNDLIDEQSGTNNSTETNREDPEEIEDNTDTGTNKEND